MTQHDDQQEVIAFLSRPETYGIVEEIGRVDTHAAIVFLAGDRAYKLKRAVRYSYLDFSTPEKRRTVCERELALNRRTAPDLYIGVESVNRGADGELTFGEGEPVDWLATMHRFASDDLFAAIAERGELDARLVRDLVDEIARFHDEAEVVRVADGADRVGAVIEGNIASMRDLPEGLLQQVDVEALHRASCSELDDLRTLLDRRGESGHVRHCHGDLHLSNICLWRGRPTLFDCLEFDPELARIDVLYDLAFLVMDLLRRDLPDHASLVFNRYCDLRAEEDGIAALPLFISMRAAIRAHVTAMAADNADDAAAREAKLTDARAYLALARRVLDREAPLLVAVGGLSGTGKSTLAVNLAALIGAAPGARWLRSDVLRKLLAGVEPEDRLPDDAYSPESSAAVYDEMARLAREALQAGFPVIVDAVFAREEEREAMRQLARDLDLRFIGLWLDAPEAVLAQRVDARKNDASDADSTVVRRQAAYDLGDLGDWQIIDASGLVSETLELARRHLETI